MEIRGENSCLCVDVTSCGNRQRPFCRAHQIVLMHVSETGYLWTPPMRRLLQKSWMQSTGSTLSPCVMMRVLVRCSLTSTCSTQKEISRSRWKYLVWPLLLIWPESNSKKIITTVNMGLMDGGTGMRPQHLKLWCCLIFQNHVNLFQLAHLLKMEKKCHTCFH